MLKRPRIPPPTQLRLKQPPDLYVLCQVDPKPSWWTRCQRTSGRVVTRRGHTSQGPAGYVSTRMAQLVAGHV
jgi:hypothetical protein